MSRKLRTIRFVDLFAGLGGFHIAMSRVQGVSTKCVFACELDDELRDLYKANFGQACAGDITAIDERDIPPHDILCAGFPCQPFSKAGEQKGLACGENGNLFGGHLLRVVEHHAPTFLFLENVPNLARHAGGKTWAHMVALLEELDYTVDWRVLSPHRFGVPQTRERMYIVATRGPDGLEGFSWPTQSSEEPSIYDVLEEDPDDARPIPDHYEHAMDVWNEFLSKFPRSEKLPSFPIWAKEFGANYPASVEDGFPGEYSERQLCRYRGALGQPLRDLPNGERFYSLPSYAQHSDFPVWKQRFIRQNRELYATNRSWINGWKRQLEEFPPSLQKLEWNCGGERRDIWVHIVQFRASGIRVKRTTSAPALIAMTTTQIPVVASKRRYMTVRECVALQCLDGLKHLPASNRRAFRALGNAVNPRVAGLVAQGLFDARSPAIEPRETSRAAAKRPVRLLDT